jgi:hypothetical protein
MIDKREHFETKSGHQHEIKAAFAVVRHNRLRPRHPSGNNIRTNERSIPCSYKDKITARKQRSGAL